MYVYIYMKYYIPLEKKWKKYHSNNKMSRYTGVQITITDTNIEYIVLIYRVAYLAKLIICIDYLFSSSTNKAV